MKIQQRCQLDGQIYEMEINCTNEQLRGGLKAYRNGALLQNAFPFLTAEEREFLKTGTPPHIWDKMFGDPDALNEQAMEQASLEAQERAASDANDRYYGAGD